jgi:ComF family protein
MIHLLKYEDASGFASALGEALSEEIKNFNSQDAVLVPVPLSAKRLSWRGYNQSLLLAQAISKKTGHKVGEALQRKKTPFFENLFSHPESQVQSGTREKRLANIRGKFEAVKPVPENVVLIDDVITSGATILEATRVLKRAGVKKIYVLAVAAG